MGVYIPNMSKPKSCYLCTFRIIDPTDGSVCGCVVGHNIQGIPLDQDRADECPLIEIVTCGECEWWDRKDKESPFGYCHAEKHCHFSNNWEISIYRTYKADHFCADGERRAE